MGRGKEKMVVCAQCGRYTRRDKAVTIEKAVFINPMDRNEIHDDQYVPRIMREYSYCPSCGKHLRIYDKKIKQLQVQKERELMKERQF